MKINNFCKSAFALLACALPLAVTAQTADMTHDTMNTTNSPQMGGMAPGTMNSTNPQMGNMTPAMNPSQMDNMRSDMMNAATPPQVGDMAPDFTLKTLDDQSVRLTDLTATSGVVVVVLRGWPGYQCPFCTKQAHDYVGNAGKLKAAGVQVVMVYPGPADDLKAHATEFLQDKNWPKDFLFVLDPDYSFTKAYGLRWDAPKETAYPSTFIVGKDGKITFAHVSKKHGDRVGSDTVLKALNAGMKKDDLTKPGM
ncbi:MAG TPA: peroxiredoxin-like family protein [Verrucomicrobiae bacterium]|nr:peroxiredoxin-like family protein [Verrucomicrobiae bacterium]